MGRGIFIDDITAQLTQLATHPNLPTSLRAMLPVLQAIVAGSRDGAHASDPALLYTDAAELILLLEHLTS